VKGNLRVCRWEEADEEREAAPAGEGVVVVTLGVEHVRFC